MSAHAVNIKRSSSGGAPTAAHATQFGQAGTKTIGPVPLAKVEHGNPGHLLFGAEFQKNIQDEKRPAWRAVASKEKNEHNFEMFHLKTDTVFRLRFIVMRSAGATSTDQHVFPLHSCTGITVRSLRVLPFGQTAAAMNLANNQAWERQAQNSPSSAMTKTEGPFDLHIIGSEPVDEDGVQGIQTLAEFEATALGSVALNEVTESGNVLQMRVVCDYHTQTPGEVISMDRTLYAKVYKKSKMLWSSMPASRIKAAGASQQVQDLCARFDGAIWEGRNMAATHS